MQVFPMLYKLSSKGKLLGWQISVREAGGKGIIETLYGEVGGKTLSTSDTVNEGKNAGRSNATTAYEQAAAEALSKWQDKLKRGYVESMDRALDGETDHVGGVEPMLAHTFSEHGHKMIFPCAAQPKLDGIRCFAVVNRRGTTLWSRKREPITSMAHITEWFDTFVGGYMMSDESHIFDGELYNHELRDNFDRITSLVRKKKPTEDSHIVQYHIYDMVDQLGFDMRLAKLLRTLRDYGHAHTELMDPKCPIRIVETALTETVTELLDMFDYFRRDGYEGAMARRLDTPYEHKRSYSLLKVKEMQDEEFLVIGVEEGRGKLQGHVGKFICRTETGKEFGAAIEGPLERRKYYFENPDAWRGKLLTVRFQNYTPDGVPRFPVGERFRDPML
jgi:DNA ligase-1